VGVAEPAPTSFLQAVGFADGGIQVDGEGLSARSGAGAPRAGEQMPGDGVELQGIAPGEGPQEGAHGGGPRTSQPSTASVEPARSMFVSSIESSPASADKMRVIPFTQRYPRRERPQGRRARRRGPATRTSRRGWPARGDQRRPPRGGQRRDLRENL